MGLNIEGGQFGGQERDTQMTIATQEQAPAPYDQILALIQKTDGHTDIAFAMKKTGLSEKVVRSIYEQLVRENIISERDDALTKKKIYTRVSKYTKK